MQYSASIYIINEISIGMWGINVNKNAMIIKEFKELTKRNKTTEFYKVDLHVHTPGSKDDYMVGNQKYEKVRIDEIKKIAVERGFIYRR